MSSFDKDQRGNQSSLYNNMMKDYCAGADPEILKREGALCRSPWLAGKENFRFQIV